MTIRWPFTLKETLSGLGVLALVIIGALGLCNNYRIAELEQRVIIDLDYDVSPDVKVEVQQEQKAGFAHILFPMRLKVANLSAKKISIESITSFILFPRTAEHAGVLKNNLFFPPEYNNPKFPLYLDSGQQVFLYPIVAWPMREESFQNFKSQVEKEDAYPSLSELVWSYPLDFIEPYLTFELRTASGEVKHTMFSFRQYFR